MMPHSINIERLLLHESANRLLLIGEATLSTDTEIYLPSPSPMKEFEILQLSRQRLTFDTNDEEVAFLTADMPRRMTIDGVLECIGKSLVIESFRGNWRIRCSTFHNTHLIFEV